MQNKKKNDQYINIKGWGEALMQEDKEKAIMIYFERYYGRSNQLQNAINNFQNPNTAKILIYGLETLYILSKAQDINSHYYIKQILRSKFKTIIMNELDFLQKKYQKHKVIYSDEQEKQLIKYFINFIEEYLKNFSEYIFEYVEGFYQTVKILQQQSGRFFLQMDQLEQLYEKLKQIIQSEQEKNIQGENQLTLLKQFQQFEQKQQLINKQYQQLLGITQSFQQTQKINQLILQNDNEKLENKYEQQKLPDEQNNASFGYIEIEKKEQFRNIELRNIIRSNNQQKQQFCRLKSYICNNSITYNTMSIEPTKDELISYLQFKDTEVYGGQIFNLQEQQCLNEQQFFNNHFFILREDCYQGLRKAFQSLKKTSFKKIEDVVWENVNLFHSVYIEDVYASNQGLRFQISMEPFQSKFLFMDQTASKILLSGSLLILATEPLDQLVYCQVSCKQFKVYNTRIKIMIKLINCSTIQELQQILMLIASGRKIFAIENKAFYESYCHYLMCLQLKSTQKFPFMNQIIHKKTDIPTISSCRNFYLYLDENNRVDDLSDLLDDSQKKALKQMLTKEIALIQGPPGTGKSHCGALAVKIILENIYSDDLTQESEYDPGFVEQYFKNLRKYGKQLRRPILIICQTNHALDQFLSNILQYCHYSRIVRLGHQCRDVNLRDILFSTFKQSISLKHDWQEFHEAKEQMSETAQKILNISCDLCSEDFRTKFPELANKIINEYLVKENLKFDQEIKLNSKLLILQYWLDDLFPDSILRDYLINNEFYGQNNNYTDFFQSYNLDNLFNEAKAESNKLESTKELNETLDKEEEFDQLDQDLDKESVESVDSNSESENNYDDDEYFSPSFNKKSNFQKLLQKLNQVNDLDFYDICYKLSDENFLIWNLKQEDKNILKYFILKQKVRTDLYDCGICDDIYEYERELQYLKKKSEFVDQCYIQTRNIVGVTMTGCAKYLNLLQNIKFETLVIEEAGEVLESHIVSILQNSIKHMILIGDHQQLKPHLNCYELEQKYGANISLFERLINNGVSYVTLQYQRRMKTKFADFVRLIYKNYQDHSNVQRLNKLSVRGMKDDLLFFNHSKYEEKNQQNKSKSNSFEAQMIIQFSKYLVNKGTSESQITILTTYSQQVTIIKKGIEGNIRVSTIDDYQGEENDIIILSLVRSNQDYQLGYVAIDNRVCVAFSRARIGFYVFGNFDFIYKSIEKYLDQPIISKRVGISDLWLKIIDLAQQKNVITDHLTFTCENHNESIKIMEISDWQNQKVCSKQCLEQFPCGHQCQQSCHIGYHLYKDCKEIIEEKLDCGHFCKSFCGTQNFLCNVQIEKILSNCNHLIKVRCYQQNEEMFCYQQCQRKLQCGHDCLGFCFQDCSSIKCNAEINVQLDCKHIHTIKCHEKDELFRFVCEEKCQKPQVCFHDGNDQNTCKRNCGSCLVDIECLCIEKCLSTLICGHKSQKLCYEEYFQCNQTCEFVCNCGINCQNSCDERCLLCQNNCQVFCLHSKCSKKCYENCDRKPCEFRCEITLPCGCQCMGLCGEECPKICMDITHDSQYTDIDERYYQLECKNQCVYPVDELDQFMEEQDQNIIKCQKCESIIYSSRRYEKFVKEAHKKFNSWKLDNKKTLDVSLYTTIQELLKKNFEFIKQNKLKDRGGFLDKIKINMTKSKPMEINYQYLQTIQKQLSFYIISRTLEHLTTQNNEFNRQAIILSRYYLLNEDNQYNYSEIIWQQIQQKLKTLFIYYELCVYLSKNQSQTYEQFKKQIEGYNFMLSNQQILEMEKIMYS